MRLHGLFAACFRKENRFTDASYPQHPVVCQKGRLFFYENLLPFHIVPGKKLWYNVSN